MSQRENRATCYHCAWPKQAAEEIIRVLSMQEL